MMTQFSKLLRAAALATLLAAAPILTASLQAQAPGGTDTTSSTTENSTGTVTAIAPPATVSVTSKRGPFTYRLSRDLHVIGPDGKPMMLAGVHKGQTVTVYYYTRDGEPTVARLVVLKGTGKM